MMEQLRNWLRARFSGEEPSSPQRIRPTSVNAQLRRQQRPKVAAQPKQGPGKPTQQPIETTSVGTIENNGPGKNVLIRNKYVREETGTHETLKIIDDTLLESDDEDGIDPYNTGRFDRSKNWSKRFRK